MKKTIWGRVYFGLVLLILYLPIFYLIYFSFSSGSSMDHFRHFTWEHYQTLFADKRLLAILLETIMLALLSSLAATVLGTFGAIAIQRSKEASRNLLLSLNNILIVSPDVIIGASFLILFTALGFSLGFASVLLSHIAFSVPIVVLMVLPKLKEMDNSLVDSQVLLPALTPGILSGFFMALTYSLDDFAVTFFVTGNGFTTLSVEIYSRARQGIDLEVNALSTIIFFFVLLLVGVYYVLTKRQGKKANKLGGLLR